MTNTVLQKRCCGCGGEKTANYLVCRSCWSDLPEELRDRWAAARGVTAKRIAARKIFEHVKGGA